jgi:single-stranded DNA-binding protein
MKVTLRGRIIEVSEPRTAGSSEVVEVIIHREFYDQDTGEKKGEDFFPVQVWKEKYEQFQKILEYGKKVEMKGFVNGRRTEKDGRPSFFCNIVAKEFTEI